MVRYLVGPCSVLLFCTVRRWAQALENIALDGRLLMMGLVQALFEGSMMTWIVVWVPAIQNAPEVCLTACCISYEVCMLMRYSMTMDESRCYA